MSSGEDATWTFQTIGRIRSPLKEKFGLPRQPGLVPGLKAQVEIVPPFDRDEAFKGLAGFSHIWLLCVFHLARREQWQTMVRPPRLGGNERVGVFASRAPYRPNPLALSLCTLEGIVREDTRLMINVGGCDLVDGTPVLDIKPYLPYADSVESARAGFSETVSHNLLTVNWSPTAQGQVQQWLALHPDLMELAEALIRQDPRPAYRQDASAQEYGMRVYDCNIRFCVNASTATILRVEPA